MATILGIAVIILGVLVFVQMRVIYSLLDRLLVQARIPAMAPTRAPSPPPGDSKEEMTRRHLFRVPITD